MKIDTLRELLEWLDGQINVASKKADAELATADILAGDFGDDWATAERCRASAKGWARIERKLRRYRRVVTQVVRALDAIDSDGGEGDAG